VTALVLDFDGVIADSSREAFAVALRTYAALRPESPLRAEPAALERALASDVAAVERHRLYPGFVGLMALGNRAEDFGVSLAALESGAAIRDQGEYDELCGALDRGWLAAYHRRFYEERAAFAAAWPALWRELQPPYPEVVAFLHDVRGRLPLAIATAKDRSSVEALLESYGLAGVFGPDAILDKETGVSKVAHLERLRASLGVTFAEITFVDDKLRHLEDVSALGVRCVLAAWGYNGERERRAAAQRAFTVASPADLRALAGPAGMI
jgi:phosphoglycolate phosphatase-like HAD superfamily hydrolase